MNTLTKLSIGMLTLAAGFAGTDANARDYGYHGRDHRHYPAPVVYTQPVVQRELVPGHYETRCETVMVAPERKEVRVIPAVLETRRDYFGKPYTVMIAPERREEICIPARYEKVDRQVWVPGYYKDVVVQAPVCPPPVCAPEPRPGVNVALGGKRGFFDVFFKF